MRWADDFLITGSFYELLEQAITPLVEQFLHERGLALSPEKTRIPHMEDGVDFLGHHVRKYAGKFLTKPARQNVQAFLGNVRKIVQANKQATPAHLIAQLNPVIRGWAHCHRHGASKVPFMKADTAIFKAVWYWAKRRHPKKSKSWVTRRYFHTRHGRRWIFFGKRAGTRGQVHELELLRAGDVPIQRHVKLRGAANPYDPHWEVYFEERLRVKMAHALKGRRKLLSLWKQQDGQCPVCHQKITSVTGWHNHHLVWRTHGGSDTAKNRVLRHPNCHRQVHSQQLDVHHRVPLCLLLAFTQGHKEEWTSRYILGLLAGSGVAFLLFVGIALSVAEPVVDLRLYRHLPFTMGCLLALLNTMVFRGRAF